jgi:uncharacterized protein (DUF58 family)
MRTAVATPTGTAGNGSGSPTTDARQRLHLTASGGGALVISVVLYLTAWRLGQPALAVPALAGLLMFSVAVWQAAPPRKLIAHHDAAPPRVTRGDPAEGRLSVLNASRTLRTGIAATDHCQGSPIELWLPAIRSGEAGTVTYPLPTARRGVVTLGPLLLTRGDVFGMLRRITQCGETASVLIRPRVVALSMLPAGRALHLEGPTSDTAAEGSAVFHSLRGYVPGDDLRRVHWPSTARTGSLVMRKMADASWPRTVVMLDLRPSAYRDPEYAELAVDCAASVAVGAATRNFPVTVRTTGGAQRDVTGVDDVLDWLAVVDGDDTGSLPRELDLLRRSRGVGALVVVTGAGDAGESAAISARAGQYDRVVVVNVGAGGDGAALAAPLWPGHGSRIIHLAVESLAGLQTQWERHAL